MEQTCILHRLYLIKHYAVLLSSYKLLSEIDLKQDKTDNANTGD